MKSSTMSLFLCAAAAGCATRTATAPDRPLFRLATSGVAPVAGASIVPEDVPSGPPVAAYTVELVIVKSDGTTLTAPRVTSYAGQRASIQIIDQMSYIQDFDVEGDREAWIADPVIGVLRTGCAVEIAVHHAAGRDDEAALAYAVSLSDVRRPIAVQQIDALSPAIRQPVSIQLPRVESASVGGARRVRLGDEIEIARVPDPSGSGELVVRGTVRKTMVPGPADGKSSDANAGAAREEIERRAALDGLVRAAAKGATSATLRVSAVRMPAGVADPDARGVERLATLAVDSVIAPGATFSDRLAEAYVQDWDVEKAHGAACDPVIATHDSGLTVTVTGERELHVSWRTTPRFDRFQISPFDGSRFGIVSPPPTAAEKAFRLPIDIPTSTAAERTVAFDPGRTVHPVFRLPDGGTAALVIDYEPSR